jgi:hypothetical protein
MRGVGGEGEAVLSFELRRRWKAGRKRGVGGWRLERRGQRVEVGGWSKKKQGVGRQKK